MDSVAKRVDKIDCILRSIFDETNDENVREVKGTYDFDQYENALTNQNVDMIGEQMGLSDGSYDRYTKG